LFRLRSYRLPANVKTTKIKTTFVEDILLNIIKFPANLGIFLKR